MVVVVLVLREHPAQPERGAELRVCRLLENSTVLTWDQWPLHVLGH